MTNQVATVQHDETSFLSVIERIASNPEVDVSKMQALLDMQERVLDRNAEIAFNQALARIAGRMPRIRKDGSVGYVDKATGQVKETFRFARYEDIIAAVQPLLTEEGFSLSFTTEPRQGEGGGLVIHGTLSHKDGHSKTASIPLALDGSGGKNNIQGIGSTTSYGKRYTTCMLLNIVTENEDDDANRASLEPIDADTVTLINSLLDETKSDLKRFLQTMNAASVAEIAKKDLPLAMSALSRKRAKAVEGTAK